MKGKRRSGRVLEVEKGRGGGVGGGGGGRKGGVGVEGGMEVVRTTREE